MEHRFKADLHGWLEYESQRSIHTEPKLKVVRVNRVPEELIASFGLTLAYYHHSKKALKALHDVLLYAVLNQQNYATDFDAPRFEAGVDHGLLHDIAHHFDLHVYTVQAIMSMPARDALDFMDRTVTIHGSVRYFHRVFIKIIQRPHLLSDSEFSYFETWISKQLVLDHDLNSLPEHIELLIETLYHCVHSKAETDTNRLWSILQDIISFTDKVKLSLLPTTHAYMRLLHQQQTAPATHPLTPLTCQSTRLPQDLLATWQQSDRLHVTQHQSAFITICSHLSTQGLNKFKTGNEFKALEDFLQQQQQTDPLTPSKLYCCLVLHHRSDYWVSVLKVMTQFIDLWLDDLEVTGCRDAYVSLVAQQEMMPILFHTASIHSNDPSLSKRLSCLLKQCMEQSTLDQLLDLLDQTYTDRLYDSPMHTHCQLPVYQDITLWGFSFEAQLNKLCNQITLTIEDDTQSTIPHDIIHAFIQLIIVSPVDTFRALIALCINNKNQYKAILPIFWAAKSVFCCSFLTLFQEQMATKLCLDQENTIQFIQACCQPASHSPQVPTLLITKDDDPVLLRVNQLVDEFILPTLQQALLPVSSDITLPLHTTRLCLALLCSLTSSASMDWTEHELDRLIQQTTPCFFQSSVALLASLLSTWADLRQTGNFVPGSVVQYLQLQDWEHVILFLERLVKLCACAVQRNQLLDVQQTLYRELALYTWQTQLIWSPIRPSVTPFDFQALMAGTEPITMEVWLSLFEACKISTAMTDTLLVPGPQLSTLTLHPFDCTLILTGFQTVLYPHPSLSVAHEYPRLIHHFLWRLYDLGSMASVLREYRHYSQPELVTPMIKQLNDHDMALFYSVLYTTQLLKHQADRVKDPTLKSSNLYYMSSLIKVIQNLKDWSHISQRGQSVSYATLRKTLKTIPDTPSMSTQGLFEQDKLITHSRLLYYPLLHLPELVSERALSVLTLHHLASVCLEVEYEPVMQDTLKRLMLHVAEGLIDMSSRHQFQRMLAQQPKSRLTHWKKKVKAGGLGTVMKMRPGLVAEESQLLMPVLSQLVFMNDLMEALPLSTCQDILYFA